MRDLATEIAGLDALSSAQLRGALIKLIGEPPPRVRQGVLRLALARELQTAAHGGLPRAVQQQLEQNALGKTRTSAASPGMHLVREWNGVAHWVEVSDDRTVSGSDHSLRRGCRRKICRRRR